jgi:hypothetical protein
MARVNISVKISSSMIEVFKTNIKYRNQANQVIERIHENFSNYKANVDLEDCDKILRVENKTGTIPASVLIDLLKELGVEAEVLPDDVIEGTDVYANTINRTINF